MCLFLGVEGAEGPSGVVGRPGTRGKPGEIGQPGWKGFVRFKLNSCINDSNSIFLIGYVYIF